MGLTDDEAGRARAFLAVLFCTVTLGIAERVGLGTDVWLQPHPDGTFSFIDPPPPDPHAPKA